MSLPWPCAYLFNTRGYGGYVFCFVLLNRTCTIELIHNHARVIPTSCYNQNTSPEVSIKQKKQHQTPIVWLGEHFVQEVSPQLYRNLTAPSHGTNVSVCVCVAVSRGLVCRKSPSSIKRRTKRKRGRQTRQADSARSKKKRNQQPARTFTERFRLGKSENKDRKFLCPATSAARLQRTQPGPGPAV